MEPKMSIPLDKPIEEVLQELCSGAKTKSENEITFAPDNPGKTAMRNFYRLILWLLIPYAPVDKKLARKADAYRKKIKELTGRSRRAR